MRVDVICVNFRTEQLLPRLLDDVARLSQFGLDPRVIVVDCSGTIGDELTRSAVRVLDPGGNIGFGAASNLAVREGGPVDVLLFVNPDVRFDAAAVAAVVDVVAAGEAVAATGRLRNQDGTLQRNTSPCPSLRQFARFYLAGIETRDAPSPGRREVEVISGALLAVRPDAFHRAGGFEARYPLYMEDVALCLALAEDGPLVQLPVECGIHRGAAAADSAPHASATLLHASRVAFFQHRGRLAGAAARTIVVVGLALRRAAGRDVPLRAVVTATRPGTDPAALLPARPDPDRQDPP